MKSQTCERTTATLPLYARDLRNAPSIGVTSIRFTTNLALRTASSKPVSCTVMENGIIHACAITKYRDAAFKDMGMNIFSLGSITHFEKIYYPFSWMKENQIN